MSVEESKVAPRVEMDDYPIIDLSNYLNKTEEASWKQDCQTISKLLNEYGFLIVRDPRVDHKENDTFLDMLEQYYNQDEEVKKSDVRSELHYQVGITPTRTERARDHCHTYNKLKEQPQTECPPELDNKLRFFWRMGEQPPQTEFQQLNADPVIPVGFPQWAEVMNKWGSLMLAAVGTVSEMMALGWDLPVDAFTKLQKYAPHLLGPTGSDLGKFNVPGTLLASYHYDLNFLTIHGRSRFPGLSVWARDGSKIKVKVPQGCLLLQAGKQLEWLTGGYVLAGFHEVVVAEETLGAIEKAKAEGRPLWRVSSTLFGHIASDQVLEPLGKFANDDSLSKYPPTKAGKQVQDELAAIKLGKGEIASN